MNQDIYDEKINNLLNCIREFGSNIVYYAKIKNELKEFIKSNSNYGTLVKNEGIVDLIKSFNDYLDQDIQSQQDFIHNPSLNHDIFKDCSSHVEIVNSKFDQILAKIDGNNKSNDGQLDEMENEFKYTSMKRLDALNQLYVDSYNSFRQELIDYSISKSDNDSSKRELTKKDLEIFKRKPIYVDENLEIYQIHSIELANKMVFYDSVELDYKRGINGIGGKFNDKLYIKVVSVDSGLNLLAPSYENAILQFYRILFPLSKSTLISPTRILAINDFSTLDMTKSNNIALDFKQLKQQFRVYSLQDIIDREPLFQKFERYKDLEADQVNDLEFKKLYQQYKEGLVDELFALKPEFKLHYQNSIINYRNIFIQASLLVDGIGLQEYLENNEKENKSIFENLNVESYSSHIISSLLVIPNDYVPSNLMIENSTNYIIGIDNCSSLNSNEVQIDSSDNGLIHLKAVNVLYTLKELMMRSVNENVKNQIIQINPCKFILDWLLSIISKNSDLESFVEIPFNLSPITVEETEEAATPTQGFNRKQLKRLLIARVKNELKIPLKFSKKWIVLMFERFKKIKQLLINDNSISHQDLFEQVHPLASIYYNVLEEIYSGSPLKQMNSIYCDRLDLVSLISQSPLSEQEKFDLQLKVRNMVSFSNPNIYSGSDKDSNSIEDTIKELIENTEFTDFSNDLELIEWLKLIICLFDNQNDDSSTSIKFHSSFSNKKIKILSNLFKNGLASIDLIDNFIKLFKITKQDIVNSKIPILNNIINSNEANILEHVEYLLNTFDLDTETLENGLTLLDISTKYKDLDLFKILLDKGAGRKSNCKMISEFYQVLSDDQKLELKPYLLKLFQVKPESNWIISLNQLLPILESSNSTTDNVLVFVENGEMRKIPEKYLNSLLDYCNSSDKLNSSKAILIEDEFGNGLYLKFGDSHSNELAITNLSRLLFGDEEIIKPFSTLATFNGKSILIYQQILGDPLIDLFNKDKDVINQIEPTSLSKQIIMSIILNNNSSSSNLNNFILTPFNNSNNTQFNKLYIKNETTDGKSSFGGYIKLDDSEKDKICDNNSEIIIKNEKSSGKLSFGGSIQFDSSGNLGNKVNVKDKKNNEDEIEGFSFVVIKRDKSTQERNYKYKIYSINSGTGSNNNSNNNNQSSSPNLQICSILFLFNQMNHSCNHQVLKQLKKMDIYSILENWITGLNQNKVVTNSLLFSKDSIKQIHSKLKSLQSIAVKEKSITHAEILNILEPEVSAKVKQISENSRNLTIQQRYSKLKQILSDDITISSPNTKVTSTVEASNQNQLDNLLKQLLEISKESNEANELLASISKCDKKDIKHLIQDGGNELEDVLKQISVISDYDELKLFELIKKSKIKCLYLKNSNLIKKRILKQFKLDNLVKIDLSGSQLTSLRDVIGSMTFKSLVSLKIDNCKKMKTIDVVAPELKEFSATFNSRLTSFYLKSPQLTSLNMNNSVNNGPIYTFIQNHFQNLEYLNISGYQGYDEMIINFKKLKVLDCSYTLSVKYILFNVPLIEKINLDGCKSLREIRSSFGNENDHHKNLWNVLNQSDNRQFINSNSIKTFSIVNNEYRQVVKVKPFTIEELNNNNNNNNNNS